MRRRRWFRSVATILAIWFPLILGEPVVLPPCPVHGGAAPTMSADAMSAHGMAHHHGTSHDSAPGHKHHNCTCINCCIGSVVAAPAPAPSTAECAVAILDTDVAPSAAPSIPRATPEFSRPYNTGPPRA